MKVIKILKKFENKPSCPVCVKDGELIALNAGNISIMPRQDCQHTSCQITRYKLIQIPMGGMLMNGWVCDRYYGAITK